LTPKYKFGLYVPHSKDSFNCLADSCCSIDCDPSAFTAAGTIAARARTDDCENLILEVLMCVVTQNISIGHSRQTRNVGNTKQVFESEVYLCYYLRTHTIPDPDDAKMWGL
jgi:hypothetical protein